MMHKPIPLQKTNIESNTKTHCLAPATRLSLITSTLHLAGQLTRSNNELTQIVIKQSLRNWQAALESEIAHMQLAKALQVTIHEWTTLHIETLGPQASRNQRAEKLFRHIHSCMHIFNLDAQPAALNVLHVVLLHPINNLSPQMCKQQKEISAIISDLYHQKSGRPNYHKISNKLFVQTSPTNKKTNPKPWIYMGIGMTFGFLLASVLNYQLLGLCSQ